MTKHRATPYLAAVLCLLLSGCYSEVQGWKVHSMVAQCEPHGGVETIGNVMFQFAVCRDGFTVEPKRAK
jgi:hypothetical protein